MNFDPLSFAIGNHGDSGPVRDVVSYLIGRTVGTAGEIWKTLTNVAVASFTAVPSTLRDLVIDVTPVQSGSGDPSPTNVRPISGWTGANICDTRDNAWNEQWDEGAYWTDTANAGQPLAATGRIRSLPASPISVTGNTDYVFYAGHQRVSQILWYDASDAFISVTANAVNPAVIKSPANAKYLRFMMPSAYGATYQNDVIIAVGTTITIPFPNPPETVYAGTLTWIGENQWKLTVTSIGIDTGILTWALVSQNRWKSAVSGIKGYADNEVANIISEKYVAGSPSQVYSHLAQITSQGGYLWIWNNSTEITPTGLCVCELATPVEYTITVPDSEIKTLLGDNNIFADCGNINTITYRES